MAKRWIPVEDGGYGAVDTVTVSDNGAMLVIDSAYGIGHKSSGMFPLSDDMRLCALTEVPAQGEAWEPVPDGELVPTITDGEMWAYRRDGKLGKAVAIRKGSFHGDIILADEYAVCRRVDAPTPPTPATN